MLRGSGLSFLLALRRWLLLGRRSRLSLWGRRLLRTSLRLHLLLMLLRRRRGSRLVLRWRSLLRASLRLDLLLMLLLWRRLRGFILRRRSGSGLVLWRRLLRTRLRLHLLLMLLLWRTLRGFILRRRSYWLGRWLIRRRLVAIGLPGRWSWLRGGWSIRLHVLLRAIRAGRIGWRLLGSRRRARSWSGARGNYRGDGLALLNGLRCHDDSGLAVIDGRKLLFILRGLFAMLNLGGHGRNALFTGRSYFRGSGPASDAAGAVVADAIHGGVIDGGVVDNRIGDGAVVDLYVSGAHVVDGAVVVKAVAVPIAALVAGPSVAIAIVNAAVISDVAAPIAVMVAIAMTVISPPSGCPQIARFGRTRPCTGNPVVALRRPTPVAGGPYIAIAGNFRLRILRERRRWIGGVLYWFAVVIFAAVVVVASVVAGGIIVIAGVVVIATRVAGIAVAVFTRIAAAGITAARIAIRRGSGVVAGIIRILLRVGIGGLLLIGCRLSGSGRQVGGGRGILRLIRWSGAWLRLGSVVHRFVASRECKGEREGCGYQS